MRIHFSGFLGVGLLGLGLFLFPTSAFGANSVVISEIAAYEANGYEWVEVYNTDAASVDMTGWKFWEATTNHGLTLAQGADMTLAPGEYAVIVQDPNKFLEHYAGFTGKIFDSSWGSLNESGEEVGLKDGAGNFVEQFTYISAPNFSLQRRNALLNDYTDANWAEHASGGTPGMANDFTAANAAPVARITEIATTTLGNSIRFDASSSTDDVGIVLYSWDFGDGGTATGVAADHTYGAVGAFTATLTVTDGSGAMSTVTVQVAVVAPIVYEKLVINEFVSNPSDGAKEWVEIYNASTSTVTLDGWKVEDATNNTVLSFGGTIGPNGFAAMELSSARLNNGGDTITLKRPDGVVADQILYGAGGMVAPGKAQAGARSADGVDTDNNSDWTITPTPTFGAANQISQVLTPVNVITPPPSGGGSIPPASFPVRSVVINEFLSNPGDEMEEFVELYSTVGYGIDLQGWSLEDGSETKTLLTGRIESRQFFVIDSPRGSLNNAGDVIRLLDPSGKEIDRVVYGNWDDGSKGDNIAAPTQGVSMARKKDGQDTDIDYMDFSLTKIVTRGQMNVIQGVETVMPVALTTSSTVRLSELYPNPPGSDVVEEFIEVQNVSVSEARLNGFVLRDSSTKFILPDIALAPGAFAVWKRDVTKIALNNTNGDVVTLLDPNGAVVDTVNYAGAAKEGQSYSKQTSGLWAWTITTTPGAVNAAVATPAGPVIALEFKKEGLVGESWDFDASDTVGVVTNTLEYVWNFGDGKTGQGEVMEHVYTTPGRYEGSLFVKESEMMSSTLAFVVTVRASADELGTGGPWERDGVDQILITEILPNPAGSDDAEFITLFNPNSFSVDVSLLKLDDSDGGSKPYTISTGVIIPAQSARVFPKSETKLALNNDTDTVRILYPDGTVLREVKYEKGKEGQVYTRNANGEWGWVKDGQVIGVKNVQKVEKVQNVTTAVKGVKLTGAVNFQSGLKVGQRVTVQGVVTVLPGVFGTQYFYIQNMNTSTLSGVQVYMNNKDFPELAVGDVIMATGEVSEVSGEKRVKVKVRGDISVLSSDTVIEPARLAIDKVESSMVGTLLSLEGEVTEVKSGSLFIDDGTGEIKVALKARANIDSSSFALGDMVRIAGVLRGREDALELSPRFQEDIEEVRSAEAEVVPEVKGEKISAQSDINRYVSVALIGIAFAGAGLLLRPRLEFAWRNVREKFKK